MSDLTDGATKTYSAPSPNADQTDGLSRSYNSGGMKSSASVADYQALLEDRRKQRLSVEAIGRFASEEDFASKIITLQNSN